MHSNKQAPQEWRNVLPSNLWLGDPRFRFIPCLMSPVVLVGFAAYRLVARVRRMVAPESRASDGGESKQGVIAAALSERRGAVLKGLAVVAAAMTAAVTIIPGPAAAIGPVAGVVIPALFPGVGFAVPVVPAVAVVGLAAYGSYKAGAAVYEATKGKKD